MGEGTKHEDGKHIRRRGGPVHPQGVDGQARLGQRGAACACCMTGKTLVAVFSINWFVCHGFSMSDQHSSHQQPSSC